MDGDDLDIGAVKGVGGGGHLVVGDEEVGDAGTVGDEDPTARTLIPASPNVNAVAASDPGWSASRSSMSFMGPAPFRCRLRTAEASSTTSST